ncbi:hypothetical protein Ancab_013927 [Ancistrocladus abbreviatus]
MLNRGDSRNSSRKQASNSLSSILRFFNKGLILHPPNFSNAIQLTPDFSHHTAISHLHETKRNSSTGRLSSIVAAPESDIITNIPSLEANMKARYAADDLDYNLTIRRFMSKGLN